MSNVTDDVKSIVPELLRKGVKLAIATHTDKAKYTRTRTVKTHLYGEDLVNAVLEHAVPDHAKEFYIAAYNP